MTVKAFNRLGIYLLLNHSELVSLSLDGGFRSVILFFSLLDFLFLGLDADAEGVDLRLVLLLKFLKLRERG